MESPVQIPLPPPYQKLRRPNPKHTKNEAVRDALYEKKTVKRWLAGITVDSHPKQVNVLHRFLMFREKLGLESDPDLLVEEVRKGTNEVRIQHLQVLLDWLEGTEDSEELRYCTTDTRYAYFKAVKSFYRHNLVDLPMGILRPPAESNNVEVSTEPTANEYLQFAWRVLNSGKLGPRDRSVVLTKVQGFMDNKQLCHVFNYVAFPQMAKHFGTDDYHLWDEKKAPVKIDLVRPKTGYLHYTFLDRDAVVAMREWLALRETKFGRMRVYPSTNPRVLPKSDPIYVVKCGKLRSLRPGYVSVLFNRLGKRAGVNEEPPFDDLPAGKEAKRRYPFRSHEVRDTAITLARSVGVPREVVDFFAGHKIDVRGYDKSPKNDPEHFRDQYKKLAVYLNVLSGKEEKIRQEVSSASEDRLKRLEQKSERQDLVIKKLLKMATSGDKLDPDLLGGLSPD